MSSDPAIRGDLKQMLPQKAVAAGKGKAVTAEEQQIVEAWINSLPIQDNLQPQPQPDVLADPNTRGDLKQMPPRKKVLAGEIPDVTPEQINLIETWISEGAQ